MTTLHLVQDWSWRGYAAVLAVAVVPPTLAGWSAEGPGSMVRTVVVGEVAIAVLLLLAALASYVQYRLTDDPAMGWLCLGAVVVGARCLGVAVLQSSTTDGRHEHGDWLVVADLTAMTMLAALSRFRPRTVDPIVPGAVVTVGLALVYLVLPARVPVLDIPDAEAIAAHVGAVVVGALVALRVVRRHGLAYGSVVPPVALVLLAAGQVGGTHAVGTDVVALGVAALTVAGTVLLVGAVLGRLRSALRSQAEHLSLVRGRLASAQQDLRDEQARLHEVANSMAGIASATRLIHEDSELTGPRRLRLEWMLDHESARLARVLSRDAHPLVPDVVVPDGRGAPVAVPATVPLPVAVHDAPRRLVETVDLDRVLEPLVIAHEVAGHVVDWQPSGLAATGRADDIAEAVSILLDNSRKHAPDAAVNLVVHRGAGDTVCIVVSDDGPGISADVAEAACRWGARRAGSPGQGIGLHLAERLVHEVSGSLVLLPTTGGTSFVLSLPAPRRVRTSTAVRQLVPS